MIFFESGLADPYFCPKQTIWTERIRALLGKERSKAHICNTLRMYGTEPTSNHTTGFDFTDDLAEYVRLT
jgi:hypothetical protein